MGGATRNLVSHLIWNEPVSARTTYRAVKSRFWGLLGASILVFFWLAFAAIAIGLPFLPLARPNGAPPPDLGPPWAPNVTAWAIGLALVFGTSLLARAVHGGPTFEGHFAFKLSLGMGALALFLLVSAALERSPAQSLNNPDERASRAPGIPRA